MNASHLSPAPLGLHRSTPRPEAADLSKTFARGDYHAAAAGPSDRWETHAALALCGNIAPALDALRDFDRPEARFYEAVAHWLDGDEDTAARGLEECDGEHARKLLALVTKPRISVLAQLPWARMGAHTILEVGQNDPKFRVRNIGFSPSDLPNKPYGDINDYCDPNRPPDFYIAEMLEWQMVPPNIQELRCPILCHTADFDLHLQVLHPWLQLFDEVLVTDTTEHAAVTGLVRAPVTTVPKAFALPWTVPNPPNGPRDLDLVLTGSVFHSFWPDKAEMVHQALAVGDLTPFFLNGVLAETAYFETLGRSKFSIVCLRHPGATPTRGLEALAMGCTVLAQTDTVLALWVGKEQGLLTYDLAGGSLVREIETVLRDPETHASRARQGMDIVRREFDPWRVGAHYLRMATFLAARPRGARQRLEPPSQKRPVVRKGWLPHRHDLVLPVLREKNMERFRNTPVSDHTIHSLNDPARELLLEHAYEARKPNADLTGDKLAPLALNMYRAALRLKPDSLALRFNFIRPALHFGTETDIDEALSLAKETLEVDSNRLTLDPLDDVMPWDYCEGFFHYRAYFDLAKETLAGRRDGIADLKNLILASLHYYYGRMAKAPRHFAMAATLDPDFPVYRLWQAKDLVSRGDRASADRALPLLAALARKSLYAVEAWSLLKAMGYEHGLDVPDGDSLRLALNRLENNTVLNEDYRAIRRSPYFRAQRLDLSRNTGFATVTDRRKRGSRKALSILLADANGSRYRDFVDILSRQTLPREAYEIICADVFDRPSPRMTDMADSVFVCGQDEYLYNRNVAFNLALIEAQSDIVAFFDQRTVLAPNALEDIVSLLSPGGNARRVLVNQGATSFDRRNLHFLALRRDDAILADALDESAYFAGGRGGPYELARRLDLRGRRIDVFDGVPPGRAEEPPAATTSVDALMSELWPGKFSSLRAHTIRRNLVIEELRGKLI